jgi:SAM-dependent methyltransferase
MTIDEFIRQVAPEPTAYWAWHCYKNTIIAAVRAFGATSLLEIGGGRSPLFTADEVIHLGVTYTVNDIDQTELDLAPRYVAKVCFDIGGDLPSTTPKYDLVFSRFVFEHLEDTRKTYRNVFRLLRSGGVSLQYYPCLYCVPFMINKLIPAETLATKTLRLVYGGSIPRPKFPARYSWCFATRKMGAMLSDVGFDEVRIIPFYGHHYYDRIPLVRDIHSVVSGKLAKIDARWRAAFAYSLAQRS